MYDCGRRRWVSGKADEWRDMTMRLIDANALLEKLNKEKVPYRRDIDKVIREMTVYAPIINKPQWIPVEERLPEKYEDVLITYRNPNEKVARSWVGYRTSTGWRVYAVYRPNVTAWMPLPEPYEPDGVERENET